MTLAQEGMGEQQHLANFFQTSFLSISTGPDFSESKAAAPYRIRSQRNVIGITSD